MRRALIERMRLLMTRFKSTGSHDEGVTTRLAELRQVLAEKESALESARSEAIALGAALDEGARELASTRTRFDALEQELRTNMSVLAEFDDPDSTPRDPGDPLVSPQSLRTKIIDGFVEGWGPAAHRVSPQLRARFPDIDDDHFWKIADVALPHTALSVQRLYSAYLAVRYIVESKIPGDIVECGVFKGGSAIMLAQSLAHFGDISRKLYLFDTFDGWPTPTDEDTDFLGQQHKELYELDKQRSESDEGRSVQSVYRLGDFFGRTRNAILSSTTYPADRIVFVRGLVEDTLPHPEVSSIAILRLDTDYYTSTAWELKTLWASLNVGGVLLLDDYGQFHGARQAVDEFIAKHKIPALLHRDDVTGRTMIKIQA